MRNQQVIKLFLVLILSITYIFCFSHYGASAYDTIMNKNDVFTEGTMVGAVLVAGKSSNEALQLVDEQLTRWLSETTITLNYKEKSLPLDLTSFNFDIKETVAKVKPGEMNLVDVDIDSLEDILVSLSPTLTEDVIVIELLKEEILKSASMLETGNYQIRIENFLIDESMSEPTVISESSISMENVERELDLFVGKSIELAATSQFSLLKYVEDEIGNVSPLALSKVATAIYGTILPTNFDIIERHISSELPAYATLGFEAKSDLELNIDLVFSNPNEISYFLEFEKVNDNIKVSLKGPRLLNQYSILSEDKQSFKPKIIRQFNPQLGPTEIKVKVEGKEGQLIKVYREHRDELGSVLKKELISEDFYPPVHQVEVQGLIIDEGDSTVTPPTEDGSAEEDAENPDTSGQDGNPSNSEESSDQQDDDSLWGKENEIPK